MKTAVLIGEEGRVSCASRAGKICFTQIFAFVLQVVLQSKRSCVGVNSPTVQSGTAIIKNVYGYAHGVLERKEMLKSLTVFVES